MKQTRTVKTLFRAGFILTSLLAAPIAFAEDSASYLPSRDGPIGLSEMSTAEVGPRLHLRFGIHGEYFSSSDFLIPGDQNSQLATAVAIGFTPIEYLEVFGGIASSSNRNQRLSEAGRGDPEVIKSWGDVRFGAKLAGRVARATTAGFELGMRVPPAASAFSITPDATSVWLGPLMTYDLRQLGGTPVRLHVNANYYFDNSGNLSSFADTSPQTRQVSTFAYGIAKSRARFALGVDAPLEHLTDPIPLQPFAEYHAEIITASADPALANYVSTGGRDRHWVSVGVRARVYRGITIDVGADVSIRHTGVQYGPPLPPYEIVIGAAYPLDIDAVRHPPVKTPPPTPPTDGDIVGTVIDTKEGTPIGEAVVAVKGRAHSRVATDSDGTFKLHGIAPGPARLEITALAFDGETVSTSVVAGRSAQVKVALAAKAVTGSVSGKIVDPNGRGVQAVLHFSGTQAYDSHSAPDGSFSAALVPGTYRMAAEAPDLGSKQVAVNIAPGRDREIEVALRAPNPDVTLEGYTITLRTPVRLGSTNPRLRPKEEQEFGAVVAILQDHPEIRTLRVEAHWDASAGPTAKPLTEHQAQFIKDYLVSKGVAEGRIEALGMGGDQPLLPNIVPANRAKNRRIELHVIY